MHPLPSYANTAVIVNFRGRHYFHNTIILAKMF